jgi:DHA1 family bicyclomycin/chloramphenicol resistance-like MFS transporter
VYISYFGVSAQMFSVLFAINIIGLMTANFLNSRFVGRLGSPKMVRIALCLGVLLASALCLANVLKLPLVFTVVLLAPLMGCLSMISTNTDAMIVLKFPAHAGTATAVTGTLRYGCGALAGPVLAATFTGTAVPFASLMLVGVIGIAGCQYWLHRQR